ncbi:MAG: GGDEF domain-containing protein [Gammaproteobacteria bacterium]|nr:GGDEF domain-containing protein [Gammaproteobacteria bacterium]
MKEARNQSNSEDRWRKKFLDSQAELNLKEKEWFETEKLLRLLISRLSMIVSTQDSALINMLHDLRKSLREGADILSNHKRVKTISERIIQLEGTEQKAIKSNSELEEHEDLQIRIVSELIIELLEKVEFPVEFTTRVDDVKAILSRNNGLAELKTTTEAIIALGDMLQSIFTTMQQDKAKLEMYLQHLNGELASLDEGLKASSMLHTDKAHADESINMRVESEVLEMENSITMLVDIDGLKSAVKERLDAIRIHMENFKHQEQERNQQAVKLNAQLAKQLQRMEHECNVLKKQVIEKHKQTLSDALTGIRNRMAYDECIMGEIERFRRYGRPMSLIVFDLDNFKWVNDTYGHSVGDKTLQFIAGVLAKSIRSVDFLARYGGEEFVIILPELALTEAKQAADKICNAVARSEFKINGNNICITLSGGVAQIRKTDNSDSIFERADAALYLAKESGRNRCETE